MSTPIENNTEGLQEILQQVNNLPEAGPSNAVLYVEQTLTDEQKAQARANIGAEVLVVAVTQIEGSGLYIASHKVSEIRAAHKAGRCVVANIGSSYYAMTTINALIGVRFGALNVEGEYTSIQIMSNGSVTVSTSTLVKTDDIPEIPDISSIGGTFIINVSIDEEGNATTETSITFEDLIKYLAENRAFICMAQFAAEEGAIHVIPLTNINLLEEGVSLTFIQDFGTMLYAIGVDISSTETVISSETVFGGVKIGDQEWDGIEPADFTYTINSMIDTKLSEIGIAEEMTF